MIPDRLNIDRVALQLTFLVTAGQTVRPGFQVKLSNTQGNANVLEVQECTAVSDVALGLANGDWGDPAGVFAAGAKVNVTCYFHIIERAMAGTGGVTLGQRMAQDAASPSHGLIAGPASNPAGATLTFSPGFCLASVAVDEVFPLAVMPHFYVTA